MKPNATPSPASFTPADRRAAVIAAITMRARTLRSTPEDYEAALRRGLMVFDTLHRTAFALCMAYRVLHRAAKRGAA